MTYARSLLESKLHLIGLWAKALINRTPYLPSYHTGALTNRGTLLTWGAYSQGALGHGDDDRDVTTPEVVQALENMFVFGIGFGGWQSSVLAIPREALSEDQ